MAWNTRGLEDPSSDEFLNNPDFRQIAAFFLGWVFFYSVQIILSCPLLQENFTRAYSSFRSLITKPIKGRHGPNEPNDIEAHTPTFPETAPRDEDKTPLSNTEFNNSTTSLLRAQEGKALLVTLALCFTCASVAHFASLLRYTTAGATTCAFVVAWGGTAAQAGRLAGLLILSLELKRFSVRRREVYILWVLLLILLGFVFANNAVAVGTLRPVPPLGISLCYRRHFTPTGLASSLALILAELYLTIRFTLLISPRGLGWFSKLDLFGDSRVYRALSLLLLDVLTITSAAKPTNLLIDFVPFAIGAVVVLFAFNLASPKKEKEAAPLLWSHHDETRRFALYPTPAPSIKSTLSIRRMSTHTAHTVSLSSPGFSEHDPPPAPTRSALNLRVALRNFTTQEQQNSRAVIDGHTKAKADSPTLPSPAASQLPRLAHSSVRRFSMHSEHSVIRSARPSIQKGYRPKVKLIIVNPDERLPDVPARLPASSVTPDPGVFSTDLLWMPPPRKRSSWTKRSSASSGLTYLTPISPKNAPSQRSLYLLSPSRSYQSMVSTPHTPIPTWEEMYRRQGLQFDSRLEIPPVPSRSGSLSRQSTSPHTPAVPSVPPIIMSPVSPPPGLTKLQPIIRSSLLANTPPVERMSGIKGPRPLVTTSRPRVRPSIDGA